MSLNRLKRQNFHSRMCAAVLLLCEIGIFYMTGQPLYEAILFLTVQMLLGAVLGAFCVGIRNGKDLAVRYLGAGAGAAAAAGIFSRDPAGALILFVTALLIGLIWLAAAKLWMRHELCPGWTLLVYDTAENLEKAKKAAESRKDLIADVSHFCYEGSAEGELDHVIRIFRIPQMVLCLEKENEKMLDYCRKAGITAFMKTDPCRQGCRIGRELFYISPRRVQRCPFVKK